MRRRKKHNRNYLLIALLLLLIAVALFLFLREGQQLRHFLGKKKQIVADRIVTTPISKASLLLLEDYFDSQNIYGVFNGTFLVGRNDSIYLEKSYGFENYRQKTLITPNTAFQLASVSKQFTAVSILILKEQGKLKLSDHIQKFFPEFPYPDITIELLLTHRSGLPNYIYFCDKCMKDKATPITNSFLVTLMSRLKPQAYYPPDRTFNYSNTGYAILATIVAKLSGKSFPDFVRDEIFQPLGMTNSCFGYPRKCDSIDLATGYNRGWNEAAYTAIDGIYGDKGIHASARDLFSWDQGLYKGIIVSPRTLNDAFQPKGKKAGSKKNYGYGWRMINLEDNTRILYHTGWWEGFQTLLIRIPKDHTTIVVLKNRKAGIIDKAAILKIMYPESYKAFKQDKESQTEDEQEGG